jgi:shikimate kinase
MAQSNGMCYNIYGGVDFMTILILGVSNVGKTTTGKILANKLGYTFYDLDDEVKIRCNTTLEDFVHFGTLYERDQIRCSIINDLASTQENKVVAVTAISYAKEILPLFHQTDIISIELTDSVENIFSRLVFSDENDNIYEDDEYKYKNARHFLEDISEDLKWYAPLFSYAKYHFNINNQTPEATAESLINCFSLR